jgi:hypothetical protein
MSTGRYRIGEFTLDVSQGCLRRGDVEIALRPKSFALLQHLITHAGRLVTKDELLSKIWPNVIVTEDSLTRCISEARAALGDLLKGWAYMMLEQDEEGLIWFRRAAAVSLPNPTIIAGLTSEPALTGRDTEARATPAQYLALESTRTRTIAQWAYVPDDNAAFMKFHWRFKSGLRKAGMPEQ